MFREKANIKEFEFLRLSVDPNRAKSIFNDMKELFDTAMVDFKLQLEKEKDKMREAFQYIVNETQEKCDRKDLDNIKHRLNSYEKRF